MPGEEESSSAFAGLGGWPGVLGRLLGGGHLSTEEAKSAIGVVLSGDASPAQIAAFVVALRAKGETVEELTGLVEGFLAKAERVPVTGDLVDTCGTGGDRSRSVNVSTMAAFVVAGAGVRVCKHGGRAASSAAGSADVLEALGVVIDLGPEGVARCIDEVGMGFCFAPRFHPAMRFAQPVRRELGVATVFNILGPLANPARVPFQVVGVSDPGMAEKMVGVLAATGVRRAMVVHGAGGLDELSTTGPSTVYSFGGVFGAEDGSDGSGSPRAPGDAAGLGIVRSIVDPAALGLAPARVEDLKGGDAAANAAAMRRVLGGEAGAQRDIVLLNAAAALLVAGVERDLPGALRAAAASVDDGRASGVLDGLVACSRRQAEG